MFTCALPRFDIESSQGRVSRDIRFYRFWDGFLMFFIETSEFQVFHLSKHSRARYIILTESETPRLAERAQPKKKYIFINYISIRTNKINDE